MTAVETQSLRAFWALSLWAVLHLLLLGFLVAAGWACE